MARSDAAISILYFDGNSVSHWAASPDGEGFQIEAVTSERLDAPLRPDSLRAFAGKAEVAVERLYTIVPRHRVTARILTLPTSDLAEIASMVALTAEEFAPFPREELIVQHRAMETLPSGETRVLLVLVHRDVVDEHIALLVEAGLEPRQVYLSTSCLEAVASWAPEAAEGRIALIALGVSSLEVAVFDRGKLQFSRGVAHDGPWDLGEGHSRESLAYEVRDALAAYRRECEDGLGVSTLYVAVEDTEEPDVLSLLAEATGKNCRPATFATTLVKNPEALAGACSLIGLGGLVAARRPAPEVIELLPASLIRDRAMRGVQRQVLRGAAMAAVVLVALSAWFAQAVIQRVLLIRELRVQVEALAPSAEGVAAKQRGLRIISRQVNQDGSFLELLSAVAQAAPPSDFNFTRIEYDREEGVNIWGRALTKDLVLSDFLGNLRALGEGNLEMLSRAHSQYETASQERNETIYNYHVAIPMIDNEEPDGSAASGR